MNRKFTVFLIAMMLLVVGRGTLLGSGLERIEEWEKAGANWENAAAHRQSQADLLGEEAEGFVRESSADLSRKKEYLLKAAAARIKAGGLYGATLANLDKAAGNWEKAGSAFSGLDMTERARNARERGTEARLTATAACERAAEAYERASAIYQDDLVNQSAAAASASECAARYRELLATRK